MTVDEILARAHGGGTAEMYTLDRDLGLTEEGEVVDLHSEQSTRTLGRKGAAIPLGLAQDLGLAGGAKAAEAPVAQTAIGTSATEQAPAEQPPTEDKAPEGPRARK